MHCPLLLKETKKEQLWLNGWTRLKGDSIGDGVNGSGLGDSGGSQSFENVGLVGKVER